MTANHMEGPPLSLRYRFGSLLLDSAVPLPGFDHRRHALGGEPRARFQFQLTAGEREAAGAGRVVLAGREHRQLTVRRAPDGGYLLAVPGAAACTLLPDRRTLRWHVTGAPSVADAEFVVHTVLPRVATAQHSLVLHAATLATPHGAVLLCGRSGAGKSALSTTVASRTGWALVGDDASALEPDRAVVRVRGFDADARIRVHPGPGAAKRRMPMAEPVPGALPARVVVRLVPGAAPALRTPRVAERLIVLRDNLLRLDRGDPNLAVSELAMLAAVTRRVPVVELRHPGTPHALDATAERIIGLVSAG